MAKLLFLYSRGTPIERCTAKKKRTPDCKTFYVWRGERYKFYDFPWHDAIQYYFIASLFVISLLYAADQQRKEAAERQKKGRERAKLLKTGEERKKRERQEKGTNFMIFLDMMQFNVFNPLLFFCYNYSIASLL